MFVVLPRKAGEGDAPRQRRRREGGRAPSASLTLGTSPVRTGEDDSSSNVHRFRRELGVLLDELEAQLGLLAHQAFDEVLGLVPLVLGDLDADQRAMAA